MRHHLTMKTLRCLLALVTLTLTGAAAADCPPGSSTTWFGECDSNKGADLSPFMPNLRTWQNGYGAIAIDFQDKTSTADWPWGASWGWSTAHEADASALAHCRKRAPHCKVVMRLSNQCGAYAKGPGATYGLAVGYTPRTAAQLALSECQKSGKACKVMEAFCSNS